MANFMRWDVREAGTVAPFVGEERRGIYVLEFSNGEQYVGQTVDLVQRFATHRHGSKHHRPWPDIEYVSFWSIPTDDLDLPERGEIFRRRVMGIPLRNKAMNLDNSEPSPFDEIFSITDQAHWASGQAQYGWSKADRSERIKAWRATSGKTKLTRNLEKHDALEFRDAVLDDLNFILENLLPEPAETEAVYWSLSDYPSTSGGRFATLNVGSLELAYFPRWWDDEDLGLRCYLNLAPVICDEAEYLEICQEQGVPVGSLLELEDEEDHAEGFEITAIPYDLIYVNRLGLPIGSLREFFAAEAEELAKGHEDESESLLNAVRKLVLILMRNNKVGMYRRWHSRDLVAEALAYQPPENR